MDNNKLLTIYNEKIIDLVKNYSIFQGSHEDFKKFVGAEDKSDFEEGTQFLLLYNSEDQIVYFQDIEIIRDCEREIIIDQSFIKWTFLRSPKLWFENKFNVPKSLSHLERLKKEKIDNIIALNQETKIIVLEISSAHRKKAKELKDILKYFPKLEKNFYNSFFSLQSVQLFSILSIAVIMFITLKIVNIIPLEVINENEVLLSIKMIITVLAPLILIYVFLLFILFIAYYFDFKQHKFFILTKVLSSTKIVVFFYFLVIINFNILGSIFPLTAGKLIKEHQILALPFSETIVNLYISNKVSLVFDKTLSKPILYFGVKDGVYYYDDFFNRCNLQVAIKDSKIISISEQNKKIMTLLLDIDKDTNATKYRNYSWKIANVKNLSFDYNDTLINQSILQCDDNNTSIK